ncbi:hypothetical protein A6A06_23600 [Streptomyces sp. CB02923]|uniref:hypothetical protein n=1 Tax=Streptomyces sp. CB02923 TaxID=1718985 RepID=UPI00093ACEF0|nr:hypothetical protein [Streptomyces sp. CB02923]OKI00154.1 hypothetical protein A6A06_23600 [Streptomyces sp. CB02923]
MTGEMLGIMTCAQCKDRFMGCPECVNAIRIDPATGLPPDVIVVDGEVHRNPNPDPEAVRRTVTRPVCDDCVAQHITGATELAADRHERHRRMMQGE